MTDNKCFNELVHYIDHDLLEVLTEEQREKIYILAASSVALKERHDTLQERVETVISVIHPEITESPSTHFSDLSPESQGFTVAIVAVVAVAIATIATVLIL